MVQKAHRARHQVSEELEAPPGLPAPTTLAPPPGLPAPSGFARKKVAKRLADAELAAAGCPPGLALPPGLETIAEDVDNSDSTATGESSPPSLGSPMYVGGSSQASDEMHQVKLIGLPNQILSDMMFQAVLQQAQLSGLYTSFSTSWGKSCGEVVINMVSAEAAEWCAQHFQGRSWATDGTTVSAHLLNKKSIEHEAETKELSEGAWLEAWFHDAYVMEGFGKLDTEICEPLDIPVEIPSSNFSIDAPAFVPTCGLSAEAPVFVPGQKIVEKITHSSECSTVDGESSDEEKAAVEVAA